MQKAGFLMTRLIYHLDIKQNQPGRLLLINDDNNTSVTLQLSTRQGIYRVRKYWHQSVIVQNRIKVFTSNDK